MKKPTQATRKEDIVRSWHMVDVKDQVLGRIATQIALKLAGKAKPNFVRNLDCGDHVVVINARHVAVTGKKEKEKMYGNYSGYPGGLKAESLVADQTGKACGNYPSCSLRNAAQK
jgi:large subunit ribosomal protein L13